MFPPNLVEACFKQVRGKKPQKNKTKTKTQTGQGKVQFREKYKQVREKYRSRRLGGWWELAAE